MIAVQLGVEGLVDVEDLAEDAGEGRRVEDDLRGAAEWPWDERLCAEILERHGHAVDHSRRVVCVVWCEGGLPEAPLLGG